MWIPVATSSLSSLSVYCRLKSPEAIAHQPPDQGCVEYSERIPRPYFYVSLCSCMCVVV